MMLWYTLDTFETWLAQDVDTVYQFVQEGKNRMCLRVQGHIPVSHYLKRGVTYDALENVLENIVHILNAFDSELIKKDRVVMYIEQFLWNEHTKTVRFVPLQILGHTRFLSQRDIFCRLIQETTFHCLSEVHRQRLVEWITDGGKDHSLEQPFQLLHIEQAFSIVLTHDKKVIGRQELFGHMTISQEHVIVYTDQNNQAVLIDNDSTNGTLLNGKKIVPQQSYILKQGDRITIVEEEFICDYQRKTISQEQNQFVSW